MHKPHIRNLFDLLLYEEGCFSMLNGFLREGFLDYDVYQEWRAGKIDYLEREFSCSKETCKAFLAEVSAYAAMLAVEREAIDYVSAENLPLRISPDPKRDAEYKMLYTPATDRVQMDLFFDSAETSLAADLAEAVVSGQTKRIDHLLSALGLAKLKQLSPAVFEYFMNQR